MANNASGRFQAANCRHISAMGTHPPSTEKSILQVEIYLEK